MAVLSTIALSAAITALVAIPMLKLFCRQIDRHMDEAFPLDLRWF
ncbi:hypothetical protein [Oceanibaculum pacificum]|nr:hypothetical protein [Oceanibaculum pacificum]